MKRNAGNKYQGKCKRSNVRSRCEIGHKLLQLLNLIKSYNSFCKVLLQNSLNPSLAFITR